MPLTHQPFAHVPELEEIRSDLPPGPVATAPSLELFMGVLLLLVALAARGALRLILLGLGGWIVQRAWNGQSAT